MAKAKNSGQGKHTKVDKESQVLNRAMILFTIGCVLECVLLLLHRSYTNGTAQQLLHTYQAIRYALYGSALLLAGSGVCCALKRGSAALRKTLLWTSLGLTACFAVLLWLYPSGIRTVCVLVPVLTILAVIYYLYPLDFFVQSVALAVALCLLVLESDTLKQIFVVALLLVWALMYWNKLPCLVNRLEKRRIVALSLLLVALLVQQTVILPVLSFYALWVAGGALFALAVYHTVRQM